MKKITIIAALLMVLCSAGCGSTTEQETTTEASAAVTTTTVSEAETTTTVISETTASTEAATTVTSETTTTYTAYSEKEQMVIDVARNGYIAMTEKNYENALEYINFSAGYFLTNGEWVSDERVIEQLTEATGDDDNNMFTWFAAMEDMEFLGAQQLTAAELQEYNDFILYMAAAEDVDYSFTDAYKVFIDYPAMSQSEKELIGTEKAVHLLVVEADGEWKLDLFVSTFKEIMDSVYEMTGSETEITTTADTVPSEAELMTIGSDSLGYMDIPSDWLTYYDPSTYGMNSVQYSSPDLKSIITMVSYDMSLVENGIVTEEQLSSLDPYTLATSSYSLLTESGYGAVEAATVTLDGRTCYQVYGYLEENGGATMLVAWYFTGDDGYTRYICFESPMDISLEVCAYIEGSYRL